MAIAVIIDQNFHMRQKSRNPMIGITIAIPAATDKPPQCKAWSKRPSKKATANTGPLKRQVLTFFQPLIGITDIVSDIWRENRHLRSKWPSDGVLSENACLRHLRASERIVVAIFP